MIRTINSLIVPTLRVGGLGADALCASVATARPVARAMVFISAAVYRTPGNWANILRGGPVE